MKGHGMNMRGKNLLLLSALVILVMSLAGCAGASSVSSTYSKYIKNVMDCSYHGEFNSYMEACGATMEEAMEINESAAQYYAMELMDLNGVICDYASEELFARYTELAKKLLKATKYEVKNAKKVGDKYEVSIVISPIDINEISDDEISSFYKEFTSRYDNITNLSDADIVEVLEKYGEGVCELLEKYSNSVGYLEKKTKDVVIIIDENGNYGISSEDWELIDNMVVDMDSYY